MQTPHDDRVVLMEDLASALDDGPEWRWHGDTAAHELVRHYAGTHVSLLVSGDIQAILQRVPALPAHEGDCSSWSLFPLCAWRARP